MKLFRQPFPPRDQLPARHLIVGLGNPGAEYENTRHNVGFRAVEILAHRHRIDARRAERRALVGYGAIRGVPVVLARPITYMNLSGESVAPLMRLLNLEPQDLLVIVDEMELPVGRLRVRRGGSAGGHNGLKSLIRHLGTQEFPRVRIGVGRPADGVPVVDHVLSRFGRDEMAPIAEACQQAADAVEVAVEQGLEAAMGRFNPAGTP